MRRLLPLVLALVLVAPAEAAVPLRSVHAPRLSGKPILGETLTATRGAWRGGPTRFRYQWLRCASRCVAIGGATHSHYRVVAADAGSALAVEVTALRGRRSASKRSLRSAHVIVPPAPVPAPAAVPVALAAPAPTATATETPTATATPTPTVTATPAGLRVDGKSLKDGDTVVIPRGVNKSGSEYACIQGWGVFDGPDDLASVDAIKAWKANIVRIPLNEDCWLGINGVDPDYGGASYRNAIRAFVDKLRSRGMYAELSLMWGGPGTHPATYQPNAPDADHSPDFWASLAADYEDVPGVILAPWGETTVNWACFRDGCSDQATFAGDLYTSAGMQQAVTVMRAAGYAGPIAIPGIEYANNLQRWLDYKPVDPLNQLVAEAHLYGLNTCDDTACLNREYAPVAAAVPLILGETGETYDDSDCGSTDYINAFLDWADHHDVGYAAWTWTTWGTCGSLISDYDGTPNGAYGKYFKDHLAALN